MWDITGTIVQKSGKAEVPYLGNPHPRWEELSKDHYDWVLKSRHMRRWQGETSQNGEEPASTWDWWWCSRGGYARRESTLARRVGRRCSSSGSGRALAGPVSTASTKVYAEGE